MKKETFQGGPGQADSLLLDSQIAKDAQGERNMNVSKTGEWEIGAGRKKEQKKI